MKEERTRQKLEADRCCLYLDLYRTVTDMSLRSLESLVRKIHIIELKIHSFKGGIYDKE